MASANIAFAKMNGLGNEIIVADMRRCADIFTPEAAIRLAGDRDTAFDQIMAVHAPRTAGTDGYIHILNSDGSDAGACGNGMRCVVSWLKRQTGNDDYVFETVAGQLEAGYQSNDRISVNMGVPRFLWDQIPLAEEFADTRTIELQIGPIDAPVLHTPSVVNLGNPHAVFWVDDDIWNYDLDRFGPLLENHPIFPERANITIARVVSRKSIIIRTWERGAGLTRACGSAACAAVVNGVRTDRSGRRVMVTLPGGDLEIDWQDDNFVMMTGPVRYEFSGRLDPKSGVWSREMDHQFS